MAYFIVGIILVFVAVGLGLLARHISKEGSNPVGWYIGAAVATVFAVVSMFMAFTVNIKATEVGVPITFGKVGEPMKPGFHSKLPWTRVESFPTFAFPVDLVGDGAVAAQTKDAGVMTVALQTRWYVDPNNASKLYLETRTGNENDINVKIVEPNVRQAVNGVVKSRGNLEFNDLPTDIIREEIQESLTEQLEVYGINVKDVNIRSITPDENVSNSISSFAAEQQKTKTAEQAQKTAVAEAERQKILAQGQKEAAKALGGISSSEAYMICVQTWERAVAAGNPVYSNPCTGGSPDLIVSK